MKNQTNQNKQQNLIIVQTVIKEAIAAWPEYGAELAFGMLVGSLEAVFTESSISDVYGKAAKISKDPTKIEFTKFYINSYQNWQDPEKLKSLLRIKLPKFVFSEN